MEEGFSSSQRQTIDESQCCEHALVQEGYSKAEVLPGKQRDEHARQSEDHQQEHTVGKAPPEGSGQILADFRRTAEAEKAYSVDESGDGPENEHYKDNVKGAFDGEARWHMGS